MACQLEKENKTPQEIIDKLEEKKKPKNGLPKGVIKLTDGNLALSFGKHKNTPVSKVPMSYLSWLAINSDIAKNDKGFSKWLKKIINKQAEANFVGK